MSNLPTRFQEAVQHYWIARSSQQQKQVDAGTIDAGSRGAVTGGTQMGALEVLVADLLCDAGLERLYDAACLTLATPTSPTELSHPVPELNFIQFAAQLQERARAFVQIQRAQ